MIPLLEMREKLEGIKWMPVSQGRTLTEIIQMFGLARGLEIGTFHGVGTCYIANAMGEKGIVTTVDVVRPEGESVYDCADKCGIDHARIESIVDTCGSHFVLDDMIKAGRQFDFIYIDGRHVIEDIALDFFQSDLLLAPGGWIAFDDLDWSHAHRPWANDRPERWKTEPHVRMFVERFVRPNQNYMNFREEARMFIAQKKDFQ
jgi:predicted O-methyltransferase YrrM